MSATTINLVTDTGSSSSDLITNTLTFTGTATPGLLVKLSLLDSSGFEVAKLRAIADANGNYTLTFDPVAQGIADGVYKIAARSAVPGSSDGIPGNGTSGPPGKIVGITFDTDADTLGTATVDVDPTGDENIDGTEIAAVPFTITGLDADATGVVTFTDVNGTVTTVNVSGNGSFTVDLTGFDLGSATATLAITDTAGNSATGASDGFQIICFLAGTHVATPAGETMIEALKVGDLVVTATGEAKPVMWVGRQTVSLRFADADRVLPVRIQAGALADNLPVRDLLVSADHAILVDGVLVQAGALVNGSTIVRETGVAQTFTYYHVELADHALMLAEGVAAETFIDNVDRMAFDNWDEHVALYPTGLALAEMSLPRAKSARQVPAATRARIAARAAALRPVAVAA